MPSVFSYDELLRQFAEMKIPRDKAIAEARRLSGMPPLPVAGAQPIRRRLELPVHLTLPWSLLVSDNDKCEVKGGKHALTPRYVQARATIKQRVLEQFTDVEPLAEPLSLVARVYVPDNRIHDVVNFAKGVHDALEKLVYENDAWLFRATWERAGVDVDRPRAELLIAPCLP